MKALSESSQDTHFIPTSLLDPLSIDPLARQGHGAEVVPSQMDTEVGINLQETTHSIPSNDMALPVEDQDVHEGEMEIGSEPLDFYGTLV